MDTLEFEDIVLAASVTDLGDADDHRVSDHADAVEFRMDLATGDPLAALEAYDGPMPVLATDRVETEGGDSPPGGDRLDRLQTAAGLPAVAAVDVELDTVRAGPGEAVLSAAATTGTATVVSAHDFEGTPSREAMVETLEAACEYGTVGKLAVTAGNLDDAFSVLDVTRTLARAGKTVATMAMGEAGRHTRAVAPVYGSRVGYAPVDPTAATAPGQYDLLTLSELVDRLGGRRSA